MLVSSLCRLCSAGLIYFMMSILLTLGPPYITHKHFCFRHDDMAYEGDMEWDVIMGVSEPPTDWNWLPEKDRLSRGRGKGGLHLSSHGQIFPGEAAAVAAGLRARTLGAAERICFKDALKRRGGLQEYLECRSCSTPTFSG